MKRLIVHVDRISLKRFPAAEAARLGDHLRVSLPVALATPDDSARSITRGDAQLIQVGPVKTAAGTMATRVGATLARVIAQRVKS